MLFSVTKLRTSTSHLQADHKTYTEVEQTAGHSSVLSWQGRKLNCCTSRWSAHLVYPKSHSLDPQQNFNAQLFTGILLQPKELPQNTYPAFSSSFLGMAIRIRKENITLAVILLSRKTIWVLTSWMQGELRWHFKYFHGLLTLICCGSPWVFPEDISEAVFWTLPEIFAGEII